MTLVRFRDCACPGMPHPETGDVVYLADKLPLPGVMAFYFSVSTWPDSASVADRVGWMAEIFVRHGVTGWNLLDEGGSARPLDVEELIADGAESYAIGEKASELYQERIFKRPLVSAASTSSPPTPTDGASTTPRTSGSSKRQKRSASSSATSSAGEPSPTAR
jgi:hypothetical protein